MGWSYSSSQSRLLKTVVDRPCTGQSVLVVCHFIAHFVENVRPLIEYDDSYQADESTGGGRKPRKCSIIAYCLQTFHRQWNKCNLHVSVRMGHKVVCYIFHKHQNIALVSIKLSNHSTLYSIYCIWNSGLPRSSMSCVTFATAWKKTAYWEGLWLKRSPKPKMLLKRQFTVSSRARILASNIWSSRTTSAPRIQLSSFWPPWPTTLSLERNKPFIRSRDLARSRNSSHGNGPNGEMMCLLAIYMAPSYRKPVHLIFGSTVTGWMVCARWYGSLYRLQRRCGFNNDLLNLSCQFSFHSMKRNQIYYIFCQFEIGSCIGRILTSCSRIGKNLNEQFTGLQADEQSTTTISGTSLRLLRQWYDECSQCHTPSQKAVNTKGERARRDWDMMAEKDWKPGTNDGGYAK